MAKEVWARLPRDLDGNEIQVLEVDSTVNVSFTSTPADDNALPSGTHLVLVTTTAPVWIKFGGDNVAVTAAESGAILVPAGGLYLVLKPGQTHFAVVAATSDDGVICVAKVV